MQPSETTVDPAEVAKFEAMAAEWWDPHGKFKPLHMLNPCRLDYITTQIAGEFDRDLNAPNPLQGLRILDIGCGGGLLCEPMARLGATVVGVDAAARNIPVAEAHARQSGLDIDYRFGTAEELAENGEVFDIVLNMEVVEHVADPLGYLTACQKLLRPGGLMVCSTINRNPKSFAMAIVGAEYVMRWLPKGTHEWSKFITPDELYTLIANADWNLWIARGLCLIQSRGAGNYLIAICRYITSRPVSNPPNNKYRFHVGIVSVLHRGASYLIVNQHIARAAHGLKVARFFRVCL